MRTLRTTQAFRTWRRQQKHLDTTIGFVPTMGALHSGHWSLIQRARRLCQTVVVSIFVNPLQFGPTEDYRRYPRDLARDLALCRQEHVDVVFVPQPEDLYPSDFQTTVTVNELSTRWEGAHRPCHFQGMTTIVTKLLNLVRPTQTFFGQKDYQQFLVIRQLIHDLEFDLSIVLCPTIRDSDGLALSSRNHYLGLRARHHAGQLYQGLLAGKRVIRKGERSGNTVCSLMRTVLTKTSPIRIDYLTICHAQTLEPIHHLKGAVVLLGAIRLGKIRLIDNMLVRIA